MNGRRALAAAVLTAVIAAVLAVIVYTEHANATGTVSVFVLTHHPRASITMEGGKIFHFITGGIHEALERAREAAAGKDVRIGGGADTIRQYLREGLIDELHIAI
jgi:dihydrofolate reductase